MGYRIHGAYDGTSALKLARPSYLRLAYDVRTQGQEPKTRRLHQQTPRQASVQTTPIRPRPALFVASTAFVFAMAGISGAIDAIHAHESRSHLDSVQTQVVHVAPGDTLWDIASDCGGGEVVSTVDVVSWIRAHNNLTTSALSVGQSLSIPILSKNDNLS